MRNLPRFSIFKPPSRYKRYNYIPQFYDPEKEEREKKLKELQANESILPSEINGKRIDFRAAGKFTQDYRRQRKQSNMRLLLILGILVLAFYYLYINYFETVL